MESETINRVLAEFDGYDVSLLDTIEERFKPPYYTKDLSALLGPGGVVEKICKEKKLYLALISTNNYTHEASLIPKGEPNRRGNSLATQFNKSLAKAVALACVEVIQSAHSQGSE